MAPEKPFALFLTWTCYGTWMPGDRRGYVSNTRLPQSGYLRRVNTPGTPFTADDPVTLQRARALQKGETVWLTAAQAVCAAASFVGAATARGWRIVRGAVMANHVHLVVMNCPDDGPGVRRIFKGVSQAALSDAAGTNRRWWTGRGSDRYLHDHEAIEAAVRYVAGQAGKLAEIVDTVVQTPLG
jgi:REP element-mobilizing transposase RayT